MKIPHSFNTVDVSILDAFKILCIKIRLRFRRLFRRCLIMFRLNKVAIYLIPFWLLFICIAFSFERKINVDINFFDVLLEIKGDIFTSFVIVVLSNTLTGIKKHKTILNKQYEYYNRLYSLADDFFFEIYYDVKRKKGPYNALDTKQRFNNFYKEIGNNVNPKIARKYTKLIHRILVEIKNDEYYNEFYNQKDFIIGTSVNDFRRIIDQLLSFKTNNDLVDNIHLLFDLIDELGYIWRVDISLRIKIDKILHEKYALVDYDDKFLYEIFYNSNIDINPYQSLVDSFFPPHSIVYCKGKKYIIKIKGRN